MLPTGFPMRSPPFAADRCILRDIYCGGICDAAYFNHSLPFGNCDLTSCSGLWNVSWVVLLTSKTWQLWKFFGGSYCQSNRRKYCIQIACHSGFFGMWYILYPAARLFLQFGALHPPILRCVAIEATSQMEHTAVCYIHALSSFMADAKPSASGMSRYSRSTALPYI